MRRALVVAAALIAAPLAALAADALLTVKIREASVRAGPKPFRPIVATVKYGEKVTPLGEKKEGWIEVKTPAGSRGFLHESALTEKEVAKIEGDPKGTGGGKPVASSEEVALAGKGFNPQVEAQYRSDHKELEAAYRLVDEMEARAVTAPDLDAFLREGKLGDAGRAE